MGSGSRFPAAPAPSASPASSPTSLPPPSSSLFEMRARPSSRPDAGGSIVAAPSPPSAQPIRTPLAALDAPAHAFATQLLLEHGQRAHAQGQFDLAIALYTLALGHKQRASVPDTAPEMPQPSAAPGDDLRTHLCSVALTLSAECDAHAFL